MQLTQKLKKNWGSQIKLCYNNNTLAILVEFWENGVSMPKSEENSKLVELVHVLGQLRSATRAWRWNQRIFHELAYTEGCLTFGTRIFKTPKNGVLRAAWPNKMRLLQMLSWKSFLLIELFCLAFHWETYKHMFKILLFLCSATSLLSSSDILEFVANFKATIKIMLQILYLLIIKLSCFYLNFGVSLGPFPVVSSGKNF
jgi:hypothetical protein